MAKRRALIIYSSMTGNTEQIGRAFGEVCEENGFAVSNIDATVLAQAPRLAPHIPAMRQHLADALGLDVSRVSVKATTEEHLGFTGAGEGIAAHAVCLLTK